MARQFSQNELYRLARLGAELRLSALDRERSEILRNFPDLARRVRQQASGAQRSAAPRRRGRRRMSAAERKEVSARMKRYWASRRKAKAKNA